MYTSKLKIKTSSVNTWRSLCWWLDLSRLSDNQFHIAGPATEKAHEARQEDLSSQSEDVV